MSLTWTFEKLVQANAETLEQTLVASQPPDFGSLDGYAYDGFNCAPARFVPLPARKFKKAFFKRNSMPYGLNQFVSPDSDNFADEWHVRTKMGRPAEGAFFRVGSVAKGFSANGFTYCQHLLSLDYNVAPNPRWNLVMRSIYDIIGLPNEDDTSLILGKAYLRILPGWTIFATYFVLGHRNPYVHS